MRCAFAGTPAFAARILGRLIESHHEVAAVYSQPDRPAGRGRRLRPSPVRRLAETAGLPVRTPTGLKSPEVIAELDALGLDVLVVAAYGLILPQAVLDTPRHGCINVHASLLPRWRGAAPIERAIMAGDTETGVSIMQMEAGLDTGPVYALRRCPIVDSDTGDGLHRRLADLGADCLLDVLDALPDLKPTPQDDSQATYANKLTATDQRLDFTTDARALAHRIQALNSRLPATSYLDGERLRLLRATAVAPSDGELRSPGLVLEAGKRGIRVSCGQGDLLVTELQLSRGKGNPMPAAAAVNGFPDLFAPGRTFSDHAGAEA